MIKFILGFILGAVVATIGVNGMVKLGNKAVSATDSGVGEAQNFLKDQLHSEKS